VARLASQDAVAHFARKREPHTGMTRAKWTVPALAALDAPPASSLWTERHRPVHADQLVGNAKAVERLRKWVADRVSGKAVPPVALLSGRAGLGKTSAALATLRDAGLVVVEVNGSDVNTGDRLVAVLQNNVLSVSLGHPPRRRAVLIDEADGLYGGEGERDFGAGALVKYLKSLKGGRAAPVILVANDMKPKHLRSLKADPATALCLAFYPIREGDMRTFVYRVLSREGVRAHPTLVHNVVRAADGDLRAALTQLQFQGAALGAPVAARDAEINYFDATAALLAGARALGRTPFVSETSMVTAAAFHNYLPALAAAHAGMNRVSGLAELEELASHADALCLVDGPALARKCRTQVLDHHFGAHAIAAATSAWRVEPHQHRVAWPRADLLSADRRSMFCYSALSTVATLPASASELHAWEAVVRGGPVQDALAAALATMGQPDAAVVELLECAEASHAAVRGRVAASATHSRQKVK
jgi:hypothetical protein